MKRRLISIQLLLLLSLCVSGQIDSLNDYAAIDTMQKDFGLFKNDAIFELSLRFDITDYTKNKSTVDYIPAILTYHISPTDSINREIRLKSRGVFRNKYCQFPPLSLNFKKAGFEKEDLKKIGKIKLVTHCERGNEDYLLREYLVYKLYNVLTDNSFKVRMVKMNYINTAKKSKPISTYAFFIEPTEFLAERTNSTEVEMTTLSYVNIVPEVMDRVSLFNFMIGNTDWSIPGLHNVKVLTQKNSPHPELGLLVPYDFDYAGIVNAYYAVPYEPLGLKNVRERYYVGLCRDEDIFNNALKEFIDKKEEFYKTINDFPLLSDKSKKDMIKYLDSFYKGVGNNSVVSQMLHNCKNP
jgi:hypothetical protein